MRAALNLRRSRPAPRPARRASAFTILEVILAILLFAGGTVAAMEVFHRAQAGAADGEHVLVATFHAQECVESLRNVAYANLTIGSGVMSGTTGCAASVSGLPSGSRSVTVTEPFANLKQAAVTVSWAVPGAGGSVNVVLQTYRSNV